MGTDGEPVEGGRQRRCCCETAYILAHARLGRAARRAGSRTIPRIVAVIPPGGGLHYHNRGLAINRIVVVVGTAVAAVIVAIIAVSVAAITAVIVVGAVVVIVRGGLIHGGTVACVVPQRGGQITLRARSERHNYWRRDCSARRE